MSGSKHRKKQQLIWDFTDFVARDYRENASNSALLLEKLATIENLRFRGYSENRYTLVDGLISLLTRIPVTDTELIKKTTDLFIKCSDEFGKTRLCNYWSMTYNSTLENILRTQKWTISVNDQHYIIPGVMVALKFGYTEWLDEFLANFDTNIDYALQWFSRAWDSPDAEVREAAVLFFQRFSSEQKQLIIESFTSGIYEYNANMLQFLLEQGFYAVSNPVISLMLALLREDYSTIIQEDHTITILRYLIQFLDESDLAVQAETVLRNLNSKTDQMALCVLFLQDANSRIATIAADCGYEPFRSAHKACFFFLTKQFAKYDTFDFDHSLLRSFYETTDAAMRRRITQAVRQSGNPVYLDILSLKQTSFAVDVSTHSKAMLQVLQENKQWEALWQKVIELPFINSVSALGKLLKNGWQPGNSEDNQLYQKLAEVVRSNIAQPQQLTTHMPAAVRCAALQTETSLNAFAFTPDSSQVVIAPGSPKLIFWDFLHGREEKSLTGFNLPLSHLKITADGTLFCAEQTLIPQQPGAIYRWASWEAAPTLHKLTEQPGIVKILELLPNNRLLVVREGQKPQILDATGGQLLTTLPAEQVKLALIIPEKDIMILTGEQFYSFDLTQYSLIEQDENFYRERSESIFYLGTMEKVFVGDADGAVESLVLAYSENDNKQFPLLRYYSLEGSKAGVCALTALSQHDLLVVGIGDGRIIFRSYVRSKWEVTFRTSSGQLGGLQISPDERFMAVAESNNELSLWDLRPLDLHKLLQQPLLSATAQHLAALKLLQENSAELPLRVQNSLTYILEILRYRYRYAIEIDAVPEIVAGNFDIEL